MVNHIPACLGIGYESLIQRDLVLRRRDLHQQLAYGGLARQDQPDRQCCAQPGRQGKQRQHVSKHADLYPDDMEYAGRRLLSLSRRHRHRYGLSPTSQPLADALSLLPPGSERA
jgi:hypothetical protein